MTFSGYWNVCNFQRELVVARKADAVAFQLYATFEEKTFLSLQIQNPTELRFIFTFGFVYQRHHHRLESWSLYFLQPSYLQRYADTVAGKGAP